MSSSRWKDYCYRYHRNWKTMLTSNMKPKMIGHFFATTLPWRLCKPSFHIYHCQEERERGYSKSGCWFRNRTQCMALGHLWSWVHTALRCMMGFSCLEHMVFCYWCTYLKTIHGTIFSIAVIFKANSFGYVNHPLLVCKQKARTKSFYTELDAAWLCALGRHGCLLFQGFRVSLFLCAYGAQVILSPARKKFEREKRFLLWGWFLSALLNVFGTAFFFFKIQPKF